MYYEMEKKPEDNGYFADQINLIMTHSWMKNV